MRPGRGEAEVGGGLCCWGAGAVRMACCAHWVKWWTGRWAPRVGGGSAPPRPAPVCSGGQLCCALGLSLPERF